MKIYKLTNGNTIIDMGAPNPLVSVPETMWNKGFSLFGANWWKVSATKETTTNDRVLFTLSEDDVNYTLEQIVCFYHGTRDTTHKSWDEFEVDIEESETSANGYSYECVNEDDNREWWEFHVYTDDTEVLNHRPVPKFNTEFLDEEL